MTRQTQAQAERAAYSCVLADAERHENGPEVPRGGRCRDCASFRADCLSNLADPSKLEGYGICADCPDDPQLVEADEWHEWDECWHSESEVVTARDRAEALLSDVRRTMAAFRADYVTAVSLRDEDGSLFASVTVLDGDETLYSRNEG